MHHQPRLIVSARPKPIVTYDTIVYPFELEVWGFTFACIMTQFILLQVMQYVWCKLSDRPNHIDYIYEGASHGLIYNQPINIFASDNFVKLQIFSSRPN